MKVNEPNRPGIINNYNKINKTYAAKGAKAPMGKDEVKISNEALELLRQGEDIESSSIRKEKINQLKQQIETGTYHVPSEKIAEKFLAFWKKR
jgi:negative regulator of flagellin synthesis FlgM